MRKVHLAFFKDEIVDQVNEMFSNKYKNMFIGITFDEDDEIGYPCLILPENRI